MNPLLIKPVSDLLGKAIDKIFPDDPVKRAEANLRMAELAQSGELAAMANETSIVLAQIGVNKAEVDSGSLFKGGWRPSVGWTCSAALAWNFVGRPMVLTGAALAGHPLDLPAADLSELLPVLFALLGIGGMRTIERLKGKA